MSGGIELNKAAAAVLLAGIIAMVSGLASEGLYHGGGSHHGKEEKRGYTIAGAEEGAGGAAGSSSATAEADAHVDILPFLAKADMEAGKAQEKKCTSCHTFDKGGKNGVGPNQWGLVGRTIATHEGFAYSDALGAMKGKKWGWQELSDFLANPKKFAPGNKMAFAGIKKPEDRANLLVYLNTLSDSPLSVPK